MGQHMVQYLLKKKQKVTGIDLSPFNPKEAAKSVHFVQGDIRNKDTLRKAFKDVDVIVHAAAALPRWKKEDIFSVDVDGTRNVYEVAEELGIKRVIFISSTAVYGLPKTHPISEEYPLEGVGPYGEAKVQGEAIVRSFREKGMIAPIIRPKTFVGSIRLGIFSVIFDWVYHHKNLPMLGKANNLYQLLDVDDLCDAIYKTGTLPKSKVNQEFNIGATKFGTVRDHINSLMAAEKYEGKIISFAPWLVIPPLKLLDKLKLSPFYEWSYATIYKDHYVDVSKAQKVLGWKPKLSSEQSLTNSYLWYKKHYDEVQGKEGITHTVQWNAGILKYIMDWFF